jgi:pilus assembly protein CpaC
MVSPDPARKSPQAQLGSSAPPVMSVPLVESTISPPARSSAPAIVENRLPAAPRMSSAPRAPAIVENPLVGTPEPPKPIAPPAAVPPAAEPPAAEPPKIAAAQPRPALPEKASPAAPLTQGESPIQPARFESKLADGEGVAQAAPLPVQIPAQSASKNADLQAVNIAQPVRAQATRPIEPGVEQTATLQPLPADEEFGQLPEGSPFEAIGESGTIKLRVRRSMLMRTKVDVYRTATVDEGIVELVQFTPREISLIGRSQGQTHVTFWFDDPAQPPVTYLVEVGVDAKVVEQEEEKYKLLENVINEMFPDSKVYLVLVADKLLVKGQARDSEEAAQIMTIIRAQAGNIRGGAAGGLGLTEGLATPVLSLAATGNNPGPGYTIINMLRVPGVQQVALKVKIAELNRSAARGFGVDVVGALDIWNGDELIFASILNAIGGGGTSVIASLDGGDLDIGIRYLQQRGVIRLLSEPTLVTLSGRPATFIAGGEFAVPTIVGNVGLNAVTTDFRSFGAIISFVPTVVDKDRIRLQVAPEFSQINNDLAVGGTPGLNVRAATTTVEMREGQTLAIAGLLEDNYTANNRGDLPFLAEVFGRRNTTRNETELIILVTPELVHPMEPEEVPPLPGFDVTEPTAGEFFLRGKIEGNPTRDHRSTVWPRLRQRYGMGGPAMTSGPFGHGQ